ncbi:Calaxin [Balamuthia mandrillaris]
MTSSLPHFYQEGLTTEPAWLDTVAKHFKWRYVLIGGGVLFAGLVMLRQKEAKHGKKQQQVVHRGILCSNCREPIHGIRWMCSNCADFNLCDKCEQNNVHTSSHVFLKIKIPIPPLAIPPGALLPVLYPSEVPGEGNWALNSEQISYLQSKTHFNKDELEALFVQFGSLANHSKGGIDKETFERCLGPLGVESNLLTDRIFSFFDQDGNGQIDFPELVCGLSVLTKGTLEEKIKYAFYGYDLDGDGYIDREEMYKMFKAYFYLSMESVREAVGVIEEELVLNYNDRDTQPVSAMFAGLPSSLDGQEVQKSEANEQLNDVDLAPVLQSMYQVAIEEMVDKAFANADADKDGHISYEEFKAWAVQDRTLINWLEALGSVF